MKYSAPIAVFALAVLFGCAPWQAPSVKSPGMALAQAPGHSSLVQERERSTAAPSASIIGDRVEDTYRSARFIHFEGRTSRTNGDRLDYSYWGTPDSFRTICFKGKELYGAFSLHEGRVQEFVPGHPKRLVLMYDLDREGQIPWLVHRRDLDCLYGQTTVTWVGPRAVEVPIFAQRIRQGLVRGTESVGERNCHVVEWRQEWQSKDGDQIVNTWMYYVDAKSFVLRRSQSIFNTLHDGLVINSEANDLVYQTMELSNESQPIDFNIWALVVAAGMTEKPDGLETRSSP